MGIHDIPCLVIQAFDGGMGLFFGSKTSYKVLQFFPHLRCDTVLPITGQSLHKLFRLCRILTGYAIDKPF